MWRSEVCELTFETIKEIVCFLCICMVLWCYGVMVYLAGGPVGCLLRVGLLVKCKCTRENDVQIWLWTLCRFVVLLCIGEGLAQAMKSIETTAMLHVGYRMKGWNGEKEGRKKECLF